MTEEQLVGRILTPGGWVAGRIVYDTHIRAIEPGAVAASAPAIIQALSICTCPVVAVRM